MVQISAGRMLDRTVLKVALRSSEGSGGWESQPTRGSGERLSISGRVLAPDLEIYRHELAYLSITEQNFCWKNYAK